MSRSFSQDDEEELLITRKLISGLKVVTKTRIPRWMNPKGLQPMTNSVDPTTYDASYYKSSNYADYLERGDRYKKTATELAHLLISLSLINKDSLIVDYGCAVGFLLDGFKELGFERAIGVEVSEWAREIARKKHPVVPSVESIPVPVDLLISLDVFEHMTDQEVKKALECSKPRALLARIPTSTDGGKTFHLEVSKSDPTHINCKTKEQWIEFFRGFGYQTFLRLNLYTVYDTPGVSCLLIL